MTVTYVDQFAVVTLLEVVQHRRLVQVGQVGHVFGFLEFRRVHLGQLVLAELFRLRGHCGEFVRFCISILPSFPSRFPPSVRVARLCVNRATLKIATTTRLTSRGAVDAPD